MASSAEPDVSDYQAPVTCLDCEGHKNVNSYCVDCKGNICDKCRTRRLHKEHRIFPRSHREAVKARRKVKQRCKKHPYKEYVMFCKICNKPCCHDCIAKEHVHHAFTNIEDVAKDAISNIQTYMGTLESVVLPSIEKAYGEVKDGIGNYNQSLEKAKQDSKRRFKSLHEELDRMERDLMQQLDAIKQTDTVDIERTASDIEEKRKWTNDRIAACKSALAEMSEIDLLLFSKTCKTISDVESNTSRTLPASVHVHLSSYKIPKLSELVGCIKREEGKLSGTETQYITSVRQDKSTFTPNMLNITPVKTLDDVRGDNITHSNDGVWINDRATKRLKLYNEHTENKQVLKTVPLDFTIYDMSTTSSNDIVATDGNNHRLVRISKAGNVTALCKTGQLVPRGLCVNDRQQIVVGVEADYAKQPIKLAVYTPNGSALVQEMEKDKSGKPLFTTVIYQVKQNGNGDYVLADYDRIVCVSEEGEYKWEYQVSGRRAQVVCGMVCDRYDNIIIADCMYNKISLLDSEGRLITTLMNSKDGISIPWTLTIDTKERLWIGQEKNVKIVKYIK